MSRGGRLVRLLNKCAGQWHPLRGFGNPTLASQSKSKLVLLLERRFLNAMCNSLVGLNLNPVHQDSKVGQKTGILSVMSNSLLDHDRSSVQKGFNLNPLHHSGSLRQQRGFLSVGDGDEDSGLSKHYEETKIIGYSPRQLFSVVAAVDLYEDFVPWCQKSTILMRKNDEFLEAELEIGFKFLVERYISHVELKPPRLIKTSVSQSNLFDFLNNVWEFHPGPVPGSCKLHFVVDFQFRSPLYRRVANMFFDEVVAQLVTSFGERCRTVYGPSTLIIPSTYTNPQVI